MTFPILGVLFLTPFIGALITYVVGRFRGDAAAKWTAFSFALLTMLVSFVLLALFDRSYPGYQFQYTLTHTTAMAMSYTFGVDGINLPLVLLTTIVTMPAIAVSWHIKERITLHYTMLLAIEGGLLGVFMALDLFLFFIFWEFVLIPMYFLIGIWGGPKKEYAAIKFFIYTHFGSLFFLLSIIAIYFNMEPHTFDMIEITKAAPAFPVDFQRTVFAAVLLAMLIKLPVFPFHTWLPDAHVEAPTGGSIILAGLLLKMGGYGLIRIGVFMLPLGAKALVGFMIPLAIVSTYYAALNAMMQKDLKKLIAYSSISSMGYMLFGVAALNALAIQGALFMLFAHGLISAMLFFVAGTIQHHVGTREIEKIKGCGKLMPNFMIFIVVAFFAAFGMPGLAEFPAEFFIFAGAFTVHSRATVTIVFSIIIISAYFLWKLQQIGFEEPSAELKSRKIKDIEFWTELLPLAALTVLVILLGTFPGILTNIMHASVWEAIAIAGL